MLSPCMSGDSPFPFPHPVGLLYRVGTPEEMAVGVPDGRALQDDAEVLAQTTHDRVVERLTRLNSLLSIVAPPGAPVTGEPDPAQPTAAVRPAAAASRRWLRKSKAPASDGWRADSAKPQRAPTVLMPPSTNRPRPAVRRDRKSAIA